MIDYERKCPGCGEEFTANRLNQKFCTVQCKARFHNHNKRAETQQHKAIAKITQPVHQVLWSNRQLLRANLDSEIDFNEIKKLGFRSNFITHYKQISEGRNRFYCYDLAYEFVDSQTIKIYAA